MVRAVADTFHCGSPIADEAGSFYVNGKIVTDGHFCWRCINTRIADALCYLVINSLNLNGQIISELSV